MSRDERTTSDELPSLAEPPSLAELRAALPEGAVLAAPDPGYAAAARFHSGAGSPSVIVRPSDAEEVARAVRYAAAGGLPVVVRGGGHSVWGAVPGGMTIDLGALDAVEVADGGLVRIGGGARWGDVARALQPHGLALSSGDTYSVGVGGNTLGGGMGWMVRAWGLAIDQLVGAELVTADGRLVAATESENADLFWALRGGGGNFGVVTSFLFQAHAVRAVVFGDIRVAEDADLAVVLRAWRDLMRAAPPELTATYLDVPPMDPSAPPGSAITVCWAGDDEAAARAAIAPLLAVPGVLGAELAVRAYADVLLDMPAADPEAPAPTIVDANGYLRTLDEAAIDAIVRARGALGPSMFMLRLLGGRYAEIPAEATAIAHRDAEAFAVTATFSPPGTPVGEAQATLDAAWSPVRALTVGVYGNFTNSTDPAVVDRMYPSATLARLAAVKRRWDPRNLFSRNHNIRPADAVDSGVPAPASQGD